MATLIKKLKDIELEKEGIRFLLSLKLDNLKHKNRVKNLLTNYSKKSKKGELPMEKTF